MPREILLVNVVSTTCPPAHAGVPVDNMVGCSAAIDVFVRASVIIGAGVRDVIVAGRGNGVKVAVLVGMSATTWAALPSGSHPAPSNPITIRQVQTKLNSLRRLIFAIIARH